VVIVLIDERDSHAGIAEFFERADSAETGAKDDHMGDVSHRFFQVIPKSHRWTTHSAKAVALFLGPIALLSQGAWLASITPCLATIQECGAFTPGSLKLGGLGRCPRGSYGGFDQVNLIDQAPQCIIVDAGDGTQAIKLGAFRAQARQP